MMRSRKSNLPALIARAIIFVAAFSFSVCFSFKQNRAEEKCATVFCRVPCPFQFSLFKKKLVFFLSCAEIFVFGFLLLPLLLLSSLPLSKRPKEKKYRPKKPARFDRTKRCPRTTTRGKKRLLCCKLSSHSAGVFFLLLSSARVYSSLYAREREREREREKEWRRGGVERGKFLQKICSFPSPKLQSPPPKEKGRKKRRDLKISFHLKSAKKRDTMVLCLPSTSGRAKISCRDTVSSSSNSLRNRSRRATKPLVLKQPSASLQSKTTRGNTQTFMKTSTSASSHFFFMSGKVNKRDAIKTAFSASASGFFSAANNEVNNVKKLDQSVSLYEKLERENSNVRREIVIAFRLRNKARTERTIGNVERPSDGEFMRRSYVYYPRMWIRERVFGDIYGVKARAR